LPDVLEGILQQDAGDRRTAVGCHCGGERFPRFPGSDEQQQIRGRRIVTGSIVARLFRVAFGFYVIVAIILNVLLVGQEYLDTKAMIQRELAMYQGVFGAALANALWAMDSDKLNAVASGIVAIPEISALRVTDPVNGHVFISAFNRDGTTAIDREGRDEGAS